MSFRRYVPSNVSPISPGHSPSTEKLPPGVKPASTVTISTGTATLDALLSPSSGLPISSALLVEEDGTGNYSGVVLRQYVSEGVVQGDNVWIGGVGENWWRGVPALAKQDKNAKTTDTAKEIENKMKIAWRYGVNEPKALNTAPTAESTHFCHTFDISEQMPLPSKTQVIFSPPPASQGDPYQPILSSLVSLLQPIPKMTPTTPTRIVLPDFLNPLVYGPAATNPAVLLKFLHSLLAIISSCTYASLVLSMSTSFYTRRQPLTSWIEHLCTHVIQLRPLPRPPAGTKQPQGLVNVHKGGLMLEEMAYRVGRRGLVLEEWSLPPLEDETPRVKQGFGLEKDFKSSEIVASPVSGISIKDLEF
jgi:elongator complex protein 4